MLDAMFAAQFKKKNSDGEGGKSNWQAAGLRFETTVPLTTRLPGGCCHTQTTRPHLHVRQRHTLPHTKPESPTRSHKRSRHSHREGSSGTLLGNSPASWCTTRPLYITTDHIWALARSPTNGETWGFGLGQNI